MENGKNLSFNNIRGRSSVGRAAALHAAGHRFDPCRLHHHCPLAQLVEQVTVNHLVRGSSPRGAATHGGWRNWQTRPAVSRVSWHQCSVDQRSACGPRVLPLASGTWRFESSPSSFLQTTIIRRNKNGFEGTETE